MGVTFRLQLAVCQVKGDINWFSFTLDQWTAAADHTGRHIPISLPSHGGDHTGLLQAIPTEHLCQGVLGVVL